MCKHKHYEMILAWANGSKIQYKSLDEPKWRDWCETYSPPWLEYYNYRIKPNVKKYRVAQFRHGTINAANAEQEQGFQQNIHFVKWLTDWVEYLD